MKTFLSKDLHVVLYDQKNEVFLDDGKRKFSLVYRELMIKAFLTTPCKYGNVEPQKRYDPDFSSTVKVLKVTKRTLSCAGVWPEKTHELIFMFFAIYLTVQCTLAIIDLSMNISDFPYIVESLMENVFNLMTLLKITLCRIKKKSLANILKEIKGDFSLEKYNTKKEKMAFLSYNTFSLTFVTLTLIFAMMSSGSYYFFSLATSIHMVITNVSYGYVLPYKVALLFEPTDALTFALLCMYQFLFIPCIMFGYVGADCLFFSLVLHISGQFAALSCKVEEVLEEPRNRQRRMKKIILRHIRLIRLSEALEDDFNLMIMQQLIGNTFQLCLLGYFTIISRDGGENEMMIPFGLSFFTVSGILLAYCYMGECLIKESSMVGDAFYHCEWYNISREEIKLMHIIMIRSSKQMELTSGKFCTLSLSTFTDVLKTSMAYLSLLRSVG